MKRQLHRNRTLVTAIAGLLALLLSRGASADVVRLADGRLLQGEVTEHSQEGIVFLRWDTEGVVELPWALLLPDDAVKLKKRLGYIIETDEGELDVDAVLVTLTNGSSISGMLLEDPTQPDSVVLRSQGTTITLRRSQVEAIDPIRLPILQVLEPVEIYDYLAKLYPAADAEGHYRLGDALMKATIYDRAREHFEQAVEQGGETYAEYTRDRLAACDVAIANAELQGKLRAIELLLGQNQYVRAAEAVDLLAVEYAGTGKFEMGTPDERGPGLMLLARINDEREKFLQREVARVFYLEMKRVVTDFVAGRIQTGQQATEVVPASRDQKPGFSEARGFAGGQMLQTILDRVAERLGLPKAETTLGAPLALDQREVTLTNVSDFPVPGDKQFPEGAVFMVQIDDEWISYERISGKRLMGCKRGVNGTEPRSHERGAIAVFGTDQDTAKKFAIDVRPYFESRRKSSHRASYTTGTYIVDMRGRELVKGGSPGGGGSQRTTAEQLRQRARGGGGAGGGARARDPEEWWDGLDSSARRSWLTAYFAEAALIVTGITYTTCGECGGVGAVTVYQTSGSTQRLCGRCSGPGADRIVSFY